MDNDGALSIRTSSAVKGEVHTPDDRAILRVSMIEATDDSYLFATSRPAMSLFCLMMERFQFAYGWLTQWSKTVMYVVGPIPPNTPARMSMPSITNKPSISPFKITFHPVPVVTGRLSFLNTDIDNANATYELLRDLINNFAVPKFHTHTPITLLRKIVNQNIVSKARARLCLQPIQQPQARHLDSLISTLVHRTLRFKYHPSPDILFLPINLHGFGFSSIERINDSIAIDGLGRDLNHQVLAYRQMARITLADWTCKLNKCIHPFHDSGFNASTSHKHGILPRAWITAHDAMRTLQPRLSLLPTDLSYIYQGDTHIKHITSILDSHGFPSVSGHGLRSLTAHDCSVLSEFGSWSVGSHSSFSFRPAFPRPASIPPASVAALHWTAVTAVLPSLARVVAALPAPDVLLPRALRRQHAENAIRITFATQGLQAATYGDNPALDWASDGSMVPAAAARHQRRSVTAAVTGPRSAVFILPGRASSILHGEVFAQIAAFTVAERETAARLFSDHLLTTKLLDRYTSRAEAEPRVRRMNGRAYYRWLFTLAEEHARGLRAEYTRGHCDADDAPSALNRSADHFATKAQTLSHFLPAAPVPTFTMDDYAFYTPEDGWIESSISTFFAHHRDRQTAGALSIGRSGRMTTFQYSDSRPEYPYTRAFSAYSAAVQLYARSGQLPTASVLADRNRTGAIIPRLCREGCVAIEDDYHVFVHCPQYAPYRREAGSDLARRFARRVPNGMPQDDVDQLLAAATVFYHQSAGVWPTGHSAYYLGHTPRLDSLLPRAVFQSGERHRTAVFHGQCDWHYASIRLAGRIWGAFQRRAAARDSHA
ncbi:hypothetical protein EXIGLDRAFT_736049 [Exidia glandulosa HHB12029]|uniref:Uncharacterized protein n=1 Tax=Exidia glandulosa HHB12029 TaxID=1314781 RepID=A0A165CRJ7_EXIGL|nr:hypothetical protein EXIGLDRAFT_729067 [Exidia glandulosa HHB12029]KZV94986.1 hypothetical protein EXIGLDRAFT_736049 [Exidia glandulosa HHB12029]